MEGGKDQEGRGGPEISAETPGVIRVQDKQEIGIKFQWI